MISKKNNKIILKFFLLAVMLGSFVFVVEHGTSQRVKKIDAINLKNS